MTRKDALMAALLLTCACAPAGPSTETAAMTQDPDGTCWAREVIPAIYREVPGQVQVVQAELAADGTVIRPPIYRNAPVPEVVRPRGEIRFQAPCPPRMTPEFIASLQRALAARGYYSGPISARMDAGTIAAIRRFQSERGLASGQLSLDTARDLGLVAVDLEPTPG